MPKLSTHFGCDFREWKCGGARPPSRQTASRFRCLNFQHITFVILGNGRAGVRALPPGKRWELAFPPTDHIAWQQRQCLSPVFCRSKDDDRLQNCMGNKQNLLANDAQPCGPHPAAGLAVAGKKEASHSLCGHFTVYAVGRCRLKRCQTNKPRRLLPPACPADRWRRRLAVSRRRE